MINRGCKSNCKNNQPYGKYNISYHRVKKAKRNQNRRVRWNKFKKYLYTHWYRGHSLEARMFYGFIGILITSLLVAGLVTAFGTLVADDENCDEFPNFPICSGSIPTEKPTIPVHLPSYPVPENPIGNPPSELYNSIEDIY